MAKETPAASAIPTRVVMTEPWGVMLRMAMTEPGDAGATKPPPARENQSIAAALPTMGAMITVGFMST